MKIEGVRHGTATGGVPNRMGSRRVSMRQRLVSGLVVCLSLILSGVSGVRSAACAAEPRVGVPYFVTEVDGGGGSPGIA